MSFNTLFKTSRVKKNIESKSISFLFLSIYSIFIGPVGIKEISPDGKFVLVENTGKRGDQDISKWQIKRKVDNEQEIVFTFPLNTIIASGRTIKIWSRGQGRANPPSEFVHEFEWRTGDSMVTRLISDSGEERALYSQRSSQ